jgi:hypothetical protein
MDRLRDDCASTRWILFGLNTFIVLVALVWFIGGTLLWGIIPAFSWIAATCVWAVTLGACVLFALNRRSRAARMDRDLAAARALVFEGRVVPDSEDSIQSSLLRMSLLQWEIEAPPLNTLEVLENSGRIWRANGMQIRRWIDSGVIQVGLPEPPQEDFPRRIEEIELRAPGEVAVRGLSDDERDELRRVYRLAELGVVPAVLMTIWFIVATAHYLLTAVGQPVPLYYLLLGALTLLGDTVLLVTHPFLARFKRDARAGVAMILDVGAGTAYDDGEELSTHRVSVETLPLSGRVWTVDGHPAQWRIRTAREVRTR